MSTEQGEPISAPPGRPATGRPGSAHGQASAPVAGLATVRELLAVEPLRLTLVAGTGGLDRPIRWAHAIELLDPRPYLRGGELVLTMGSALLDEGACRRFVEAVLERRASGIGFGCGNHHPSAPPALREACEAAGLPLLEVPFEVPFIAITEELAERMAAQRGERDRRALRREAHLLDVLAEGHGLDGLARSIAREIRSTVVIADLDGRLEAVAEAEPTTMNVAAVVADGIARSRRGLRRAGYDDGFVACDLVAVSHQKRQIGWLGRLRPSGEARPEALEVLREVAPVVSIELATRAQERIGDRRAVGRLLEIVRSGIADPIVFSDRLALARLDETRLVASVWEAGAADELRHTLSRAVIGEAGSRVYLVSDDPELIAAVAAERGLVCGIGGQVPLAELGRSLVEGDAAFAIAQARHGVASWRDLAEPDTLLGQQPAERLAAFVNQLIVPIVEHDAKRNGELLLTLRSFIEQEGAVEPTARRLHVHPNSLRHRLHRIRVLTGRDPLRFLDRVALYIGLWAWDSQHRRNPQSSDVNIVVSDD